MAATTSINLGISDQEKALIDQAARTLGKSRTAFILENTLRLAEEVVLGRTRFTLDSEQLEQFNTALDSPPSEEQIRGLGALFQAKTPWQQE